MKNLEVEIYVQDLAGESPPLTWRKLSKQKEYQMVCQDHLHLRGENQPNKSNDSMSAGSPPLTWRKLIRGFTVMLNTRITSTYVEKTYQ